MKIMLNKLTIENFKGVKQFEFEFGGRNAIIRAANGVGKTTIHDAFLWLLFNKDSDGDTAFGNRPVDGYNQRIPGLVVAVEAQLWIDGTVHAYRREEHERTVRGDIKGFTSKYWIDDVPQKEKDFKEAIGRIVQDDVFRMLANLTHFLGKTPWPAQRQVLLVLAGETGTPAGFDKLLSELNGRSIDDYKKVLADRKKGFVTERDEINPRIDEIQKSLEGYAQAQTDSESQLQAKRDLITQTIAGIEAERTELRAGETVRAKLQADLAELKGQKATREGQLASDTRSVDDMLNEKRTLEAAYMEQMHALSNMQAELRTKRTSLESAENDYGQAMLTIQSVRDEYGRAKNKPIDDTCYACGQRLPAEKIVALDAKRKAELASITERGNNLQRAADERKAGMDALQEEILLAEAACQNAEKELREKEEANKARYAEIEAEVKACPRPKPEDDPQWNDIMCDIQQLEKQIGPPVSEQLEQVESRIKTANADLTDINAALANYDNAEKAKERISELDTRERELSQKIADCDKQLCQIESFKMAESELIAEAVNGKFEHVAFKLFKEHLNGGLDECCEALLNGVPYSDMSTGQKTVCGVDVINVLSGHYGISVPLFVDHAESLTLPLGAKSQMIELYAEPGINSLEVTLDVGAAERQVA